MSDFIQRLSRFFEEFGRQGIHYVVAAGNAGTGIQYKRIVQVGATPFAVTFATYDLQDMAGTDYYPQIYNETAGAFQTYSGRTTTGFNVVGAANDDVLQIVIHGRLKDQTAANGAP